MHVLWLTRWYTMLCLRDHFCDYLPLICSGFWGSIELKNDFDVPVLFKWSPKNQTNFFAIQPNGISSCLAMTGFTHAQLIFQVLSLQTPQC